VPAGRAELADRGAWASELRNRRKDGSAVWVSTSATVVAGTDGEPCGSIAIIRDRTARRYAEMLDADRAGVFEMLLEQRPLKAVLAAVCRTAERQLDGIVCAVLTIDDAGRFSTAAAPSLDRRYADAVRGQPIAERGTPCAAAAYTGAPVIVEDIETDPAWADRRPLMRLWGLRSCWSTPVRAGAATVATFALYSRTPGPPEARDLRVIEELSHLVGLAVARDREATALRRSERRRARVHRLMVTAEEAERQRIAGELHDDTVQVLAATLISLDRLLASEDRAGGRRDLLDQARGTLALAVDRTRLLMFDLRPQLLDAGGLRAAVPALVEKVAAHAGIEAHVEVTEGRYPHEVEALCYRTVSECVSNVRKHAQARSVHVVLRNGGDHLEGSVRDDGVGFRPDRTGTSIREHIGLEAMRERVLLAGGSVDVASAPGKGTTVRFTLPV
jgi:signal transduction histidine kinase